MNFSCPILYPKKLINKPSHCTPSYVDSQDSIPVREPNIVGSRGGNGRNDARYFAATTKESLHAKN